MIRRLKDLVSGKVPAGARRSSKWPAVRAMHLKNNPTCVVCRGFNQLEVHHVRPFHLYPALELEPANLITLCEAGKGGLNCHLALGHLGRWTRFNPDVFRDSALWADKILRAERDDHRPPHLQKGA